MSLTSPKLSSTPFATVYLETLLAGDRNACRTHVAGALTRGVTAYQLLVEVVWPTMERIQALFRDDHITQAQLNLATRLNRTTADQLSAKIPSAEANGRKALVFCGGAEPEELGGQITSDLFAHAGWDVRFAGGGVPDDEVLTLIGEYRPHLLVMFGTLPAGVPAVRKLIDYLRNHNTLPELQVMCCGGIYKRAEGLAEEIGADLYAPDGAQAVQVAETQATRRATVDQQTVGRSRRERKAEARKSGVIGRIAPAPISKAG